MSLIYLSSPPLLLLSSSPPFFLSSSHLLLSSSPPLLLSSSPPLFSATFYQRAIQVKSASPEEEAEALGEAAR
eukprot:28359-Hanusia_phi.AAC.4